MAIQNPNSQINVSKIPIGAGVGGALAAAAMVAIILLGIPELWSLVPPALVLGVVIALALRLMRHKSLGAPWILPATKK